jgi:streptogramin lyase
MMKRVNTASPPAHHSSRIAVVVASVVAAAVGSVLLATRHSGEKATTRGITATLHIPGHPGSAVAGSDALWVALNGDPRRPVGDRPLVRLDLAGNVMQTLHLGGQASHLTRVGERLIVSVQHVGSDGSGPTQLAVVDWQNDIVLLRREFGGPIDQVVSRGHELWALEARPGTLLRLDPVTLASASAPLRLSPGRALGLTFGAGYLWVTASDAGEVLRVDPAKRTIERVPVGGFPMGIVVTAGSVWFADHEGGNVVRLDPRTLQPIGDPIEVGAKPTWLAVAAGSLFVTDQDDGTVVRIDAHSGKKVGAPIRVAEPAKDAAALAITASRTSVWVSSFASNTLTRINSTGVAAPATVSNVAHGKITLHSTETLKRPDITNGHVAGTGRFTISGAINDSGTITDYRTVKGSLALIRRVAVGKKGTITFVTRIYLATGLCDAISASSCSVTAEPWTITSGTQAYKGLHGKGTEVVDNFDSRPATFAMEGTVS